ncbi:hypothetical protein GW891_02495 [bacterium]|nr:hypothetical protein [bacterium]
MIQVVSIVKFVIGKIILSIGLDKTCIVQSVYIQSDNVFNVIVLFQITASVVELEHDHE